jgi:hypothetical protein
VGRDSHRRTELVLHFIRGFNSISGLMDLVDVGDETDRIPSKITGMAFSLSFHLTFVSDQIFAFSKSSGCCFFLLGIDSTDTYKASLEAITTRSNPPCGLCLIRLSSDDANDQGVDSFNDQFDQLAFDGLFVPRDKTTSSRLSYVDIVQKPSAAIPEKLQKPIVFPSLGARKVSNASTVSTQAEDDWCVPAVSKETDENLCTNAEDFASVVSDYSVDLSYSTSKRKKRMESRRKEILTKKFDIGLLATVKCPREEPDRS